MMTILYILGALFLLFIVWNIAFDDRKLPNEFDNRVVYYNGYPGLEPMQDGRLVVENSAVIFKTADLSKEYFKIPLNQVLRVEVIKQELSQQQLKGNTFANFIGMAPSMIFGRSDCIYVYSKNDTGEEIKTLFVNKTKNAQQLKVQIDAGLEKNTALLQTLQAMISDKSRVVDLYPQLYSGEFLAVAQLGSEDYPVNNIRLLTYSCKDSARELPVFTRREFALNNFPNDSVLVPIKGSALWSRVLDILGENEYAAVDPGQAHGIRLDRTMILGMISQYEKN